MSHPNNRRTIIVTPVDETLVATILAFFPLVRRHRVLQLALRYGLRSISRHPALLLSEAQDPSADDVLPEGREAL